METFLIIIGLIAGSFFLLGVVLPWLVSNLSFKNDKPAPKPDPLKGLSHISKRVYKEYMKLPPENRPLTDIVSALTALDVKAHGVKEVNNHFSRYHREWEYWFCYGNGPCMLSEHKELWKLIKSVREALAEQAYQASLAGAEYELNTLNELTDKLRIEKYVVESVTKEIL